MNWGPWSGVGMVSDLEGHLGARGLGMIPPAVGAGMFLDELRYGAKGVVEVIAAGNLGNLDAPVEVARPTRAERCGGGGGSMSRRGGDIAIVGMACRFPGANDLVAFWENILGGSRRDLRRSPRPLGPGHLL